jgi:precorrin-6B methylase 2
MCSLSGNKGKILACLRAKAGGVLRLLGLRRNDAPVVLEQFGGDGRNVKKMVRYVQREMLDLPESVFNMAEPLFLIETHMSFFERRELLMLALSLPENFVACEVGSYFGASTSFIAAAARMKNGTVHAVDTWNNDMMGLELAGDTFKKFSENTAAFSDLIVPHRGTSGAVTADIPKRLDFLFIDGGHTQEQVAKDVRNYASRVKKGGIVAFHDYYGDVQSAVEIWSEYATLSPHTHVHSLKSFRVVGKGIKLE